MQQRINAIGRRKTSVARIYLSEGKGSITINKTPLKTYFPVAHTSTLIKQPLREVKATDQYDVQVNVKGGGFTGQAEAIRLAIARALCEVNPEHRPSLKKKKLLARDPRSVERKKYGRKKARKKFPFRKR
ncbi:MAG: 30S ribosomal protein S9 [Bacteroidota bacterium]